MVGAVALVSPTLLLPDAQAIATQRLRNHALLRLGLSLPGAPVYADLDKRLAAAGVPLGSAMALRIHKREFELEVWLLSGDRFRHFATYPICTWSGDLGPKLAEGDRQSPEGFYMVERSSLNPNSRWHRSFNLGFPNVFDRGHGRTGSYLMVHGGCGSIGCYAITNAGIDEVWRLVVAALDAGQRGIPVLALPFRMTGARLEWANGDDRGAFWAQLAAGNEIFEATGLPPRVSVCRGRYTVSAATKRGDWQQAITERCP